MKYRPEIDGLRAIAVIAVILFHANFNAFRGGFIGVDIFFVISGYLITTILLNDLEAGNFSIAHFYERRARRILPALFLVMFACLPLAWFWLSPSDMRNFSQSLVAVTVFASNILFWRSSGYFDTATELKPLIHTWSLSIEEQYYLLFPLFLFFAWRLGKRWIVGILAVVAILSLTFAQWYVNKNPSFTFYMLPTRAWELLIGAFVAFYYSERNIKKHKYWASQLGSMLGFALIVYATFAFSSRTPFPSLYALVPSIGTALIIIFATSQTLMGKLLSKKPLLWIGLISYSAYLWHQPLFAFARHHTLEQTSQGVLAMLGVITLLLAYLTWKFVERPFRDEHRFSRNQIILLSLICSLTFMTVGIFGLKSNGFIENRQSINNSQVIFDFGTVNNTISLQDHAVTTGEKPNQTSDINSKSAFLNYFENSLPNWHFFERLGIPKLFAYECDFYDIDKYRSGNPTNIPVEKIDKSCYTRNSNQDKVVFIWGDSHAQHLRPGLSEKLPKNWQVLQVASSGCDARLGAKTNPENYCEQSNWFAFESIKQSQPDVVIIGQNQGHNLNNMLSIANTLQQIGIKKVIFTGPTPHWNKDLPSIVINLWENTPNFTKIGLDLNVVKLDNEILNTFPNTKKTHYVSLINELCNESGCQIFIGNDKKLGITSWDYGHLTPVASVKVARKKLIPLIINDE